MRKKRKKEWRSVSISPLVIKNLFPGLLHPASLYFSNITAPPKVLKTQAVAHVGYSQPLDEGMRQEDQRFKASLGHVVSSNPACTARDPAKAY